MSTSRSTSIHPRGVGVKASESATSKDDDSAAAAVGCPLYKRRRDDSITCPILIDSTTMPITKRTQYSQDGDDEDGSSVDSASPRSDTDDSSSNSSSSNGRREMLDLSINKLQCMSQRAPELRKSVLIFNTMRVLQDELDSTAEGSPVSSGDEDLEMDLPPHIVDSTTSNQTVTCPLPSNSNSFEWPSSGSTGHHYTSVSTGAPHIPPATIGAEIYMSYEMLNNANRHHQYGGVSVASYATGMARDHHQVYSWNGLASNSMKMNSSGGRGGVDDDDDEDENPMNEEEVIAALGLTDVVSAIMAD